LDVDAQTGQPGTDLFGHSLVLTSGIRQGWLEADLSGYGIRLQHPRFFLVFEWIEDSERRNRTKELMDAFAREHPDRYYERREVVDGKEEILRGLNNFLEGTFFAVSRKTDAPNHFICFTRDSSLDHWSSSQSVLTATVTLEY